MKKLCLGLTLALHAGVASAQVAAQPAQPAPPPVDANASPWGAPPPPPPQAAAPVYYAQQPMYAQPIYAPHVVPQRIPYDGGPVPQGARIVSRPRLGFVIGGGITFVASYALTLYVGALVGLSSSGSRSGQPWGWFALPVLGPIVYGAAADRLGDGAWPILVLSTLIQGGGLAMFILGFTSPAQYLVYDGRARASLRAPRWSLSPGSPGATTGATFSMTF